MAHILIIGAGISGLVAARNLLTEGHQVTLLEARPKTGGRLDTLTDTFSRPVDLGAEFIHGHLPISMSLVAEAELQTTTYHGHFYNIRKNSIERDDAYQKEWEKFYRKLAEVSDDLTLSAFLDLHFPMPASAMFRERVEGFAEGFDIADPRLASVKALGSEWANNDEEHQFRIVGGYSMLIDFLEHEISKNGGQIHCSTSILDLYWGEKQVSVSAADGRTFQGDIALITVSVGVMQHNRISIHPHLPGITDAYGKLGFGGIIKFIFEFKTMFWKEARSNAVSDGLFFITDAEVPTWWTQLPDNTPLLTGWLGGPQAFEVNADEEELFAAAIRSLAYIFDVTPNLIHAELKCWKIVNWTTDTGFYGGYSYPTVTSLVAREYLNRGIQQTIYFCGEALYEGQAPGTVEAALSSGIDVVKTMLKHLQTG